MYNFFASLRRILAVSLEQMGLGQIVHSYIKKEVIPDLLKRIETARTDNDKQLITDLLNEYYKYSDPRSVEGKLYDKTAAKVVYQTAQTARMSTDDMEDLMQDVALDFYKPLRAGGSDLMDALKRFDISNGPLALNKYWSSIVDFRTRQHIRTNIQNHKEMTLNPTETSDGDLSNPMEEMPAKFEIDEQYIESVIGDLKRYVHTHARDQRTKDLFDVWFEIDQSKGASGANMSKEVYPAFLEKGYTMTLSNMNFIWNDVRNLILSFFVKELGTEYTNRVKRVLHLSSAEVLTYSTFRRKIASWVVGGVMAKAILG